MADRPRKRAHYQAPRFSSRLYLRLPPQNLALLKFLLEAHGHLGLLSTVDRAKAVAKLTYSPDCQREVMEFLEEAGQTVAFSLAHQPGTNGA